MMRSKKNVDPKEKTNQAMEGVDYNIVFQDYLDDAARLRIDFTKSYTRVKENSLEIEKLRTRADLRANTTSKYYEAHGYVESYPQEGVQSAKIDKEIKTALSKCEDSQSRLRQLKRSFELRLKKMDQEALTWDPSTRSQPETNSYQHDNNSIVSPVKTPIPGEKRKISHSGPLGLPPSQKRQAIPGRFMKKNLKYKSPQDPREISHLPKGDFPQVQQTIVSTGEDENRLYCICDRPSFGEMVACDHPTCPKEWFHLECFGLSEAPTGRWFCPGCEEKQSNK